MTATASTIYENLLGIGANTITGVTTASTATSSAVLTFGGGVPAGVVPGMVVKDVTTGSAITAATTTVLSVTATTVTMSANAAGSGVGSGDTIQFGTLTSTSKSAGFTKGADVRGLVNLLLGQCATMEFTAATLKGLVDSGDTQTLANINDILSRLSATSYALPTS